jgi:hypothetical protein
VQGCGSSSDRAESNPQADLEVAARLERDLDPKLLDILFAQDPKVELGFPILKTEAKCGADVVKATYDPFRDLVDVAFMKDGAQVAETRTLTFNGARVWAAEGPFKGDATLYKVTNPDGSKANTDSVGWGWVEDLSAKHQKLFPDNTDVTIELGGTAMIATQKSSTTFSWVPQTFSGWRMKLHVFSKEMVKTMADHKANARRAHVELEVLHRYTSDIDMLRNSKESRAIAIVKRYDELLAAAAKKQAATATLPFAQYKDSLSVEKVPACAP